MTDLHEPVRCDECQYWDSWHQFSMIPKDERDIYGMCMNDDREWCTRNDFVCPDDGVRKMQKTLIDTLIVVEGDDGIEIEMSLDGDDLSQCLLIGRAVREALVRQAGDGASAIVRCYAK